MNDLSAAKREVITTAIDEAITRELKQSVSQKIDDLVTKKLESALLGRVDYQITRRLNERLTEQSLPRRMHLFEDFVENRVLFASRWILAPGYLMLTILLMVLCYKAGEELVQLFVEMKVFDHGRTLTQALVVVDIILTMNLVLMVLFVGYINFVSKVIPTRIEDWPEWTQTLDYSGLKIQLLGSIIAITAIVLLREIIRATDEDDVNIVRTGIVVAGQVILVFSVLAIALVNRLKHTESKSTRAGQVG